ncbi:hypothetical protein M0811_10668 [Anaeramoeba ignava]|uniref:Uncharacterized protein n=1 Tax=Anaeramoeba ignava TaxID=1746090 RepID=A0A9Q0LFL0_ANAIG|nr:hypothetical protein M0811_10668 [Anaeramoeba ignava]
MMKNEEKNIYYPHQQKPMWIKLSRENFSILEYCNETEVEVYQYLNKNQSLLCESTENPNVVRIDFKDGWVMELHFLSEKSKSVFAKAFSMFQRYLPSYTIGSPIYADILNRKQEIQALASSFVRNQNVKFQVKIQQQFSELFYSSILEIDLFKIRLISQAINHDLYFVGNVTQISKLQKQKKVLVIDVQNHDLITNPVHIFCESTTTRSLIYETLIKFWRKSRNNFLNSMELSKYEHFQSVRKQNNPHQDPILIASFNSKGEIDLIQPQLLIPEYTEINPSKYDQMYFCDSQNKKTSNDLLSQIEKKKTIGPINISIFKSEKQQFVPASFTFNLQNSTILVFDRSNFSFEFKYHKKHQLIIIQPTNKNIFLFRVDSEHALIIQTQNQKDLDCILLTYFHLRKISKFQEQENQNPNFGIPTTKAMTKRKNPKISSEFVFNFPQKSITLDNEYEDNTNQEDQEIEYQATISDVISTIHERVDIVLRSDHFSILSATFSISRYYSVHSVLIPLKKALTQNSKRDENVQFHFDEFDYILIEFPNSRVLQNFMNDFKHHKKKYLFETQKIFIPRKFHFDCVIFLPQAEKPKFNAKITLGFQYIYIEIKNDSDQECDLKDRIKFQYLNAN